MTELLFFVEEIKEYNTKNKKLKRLPKEPGRRDSQ